MAKSTKKTTAKKAVVKTKAKTTQSAKRRSAPKPAPKKEVKSQKHESPVAAVSSKGYGKKDLEFFRDIIIEKKKEILEELETLRDTMMDSTTGEYTNENPTYSTHMEQGTDTMEREKTFLFASRESKFLNYLEDALKRIEAGNYGRCITCGKLIEKERLEAVPHSQQCLNCKLQRSK